MEANAKRFARTVLLIHVLVLAIVLALVGAASREIYTSTRNEMIAEARSRQTLLANQTARGIESHYQSILNNLDLLRRAENEDGSPSTAPGAEVAVPERTVAAAARGAIVGPVLWKQLQGRVSLLMSVDRAMLSRAAPTVRIIGTDNTSISPDQVIAQSREWLESVEKPSVSGFQMYGDVGANLVCIPFPHAQEPTQPPQRGLGLGGGGGGGPQPPRFGGMRETFRLIVAVVPIREVESRFLKSLNDESDARAWLIDEHMTAMAASRPQLVGANMADVSDPELRALAADYVQRGRAGTEIVNKHFTLGGVNFVPSMVTGESIKVGDKTWELFIATDMGQVDGVVSRLFHRAILWGIFVIVSITAILVSTAVQMIRGRVRLERVRHEMIDRELTQAREIQLAWLPSSEVPMQSIDIAAINSPASHISGDFYNWFELPDGRLVVTIGDVTGHGMAAAFLMATTQLLVRNTMMRLGDPGACLAEVNRQLCVQVFNGQFVTMLVMVLDLNSGALEIATAGHPAPLLADGESFQPLPLEPQLVLGIERNTHYITEKYRLPPQSSLLLYTDGVVECLGTDGSRFGSDGLQRTLYGKYDSAQAILDRVVTAVDAFRGELELTDDLTLVAVQMQASRVRLEKVPAIA